MLCYLASNPVNTAPIQCKKPKDLAKALEEIKSNYFVADLKFPSPNSFKIDTELRNTVEASGCKYRFVETKKNPDQYPQTLLTAECDKGRQGYCDPRCKPISYMVTVLQQNKQCDDRIGQMTWSVKQIRIIVGYEM